MIGLGLLGSVIARRLEEAGFDVVGRDPDPSRAEALGIATVDTPRQLAEAYETIVLCLPDSNVVDAVVSGDDGLSSAFETEESARLRLVVDCTTGDPARSLAVAETLAERGVAYVEALANGSSEAFRRGEGVLLVGGASEAVESSYDVLDAIASIVYVLGPPGSGARMKLVSNLILGLNRLALAEGVALAEKCGFDVSTFLEVVRSGPAHSRALEHKGEKIRQGDFAPQARLAQHLKDVRLKLELGAEVGAELPTTRLHRELLERGVEMGLGDVDNSAIVEVLRGLEA